MARPLRIQFSGAVYHDINRGTARQATFVQKQDYEAFLKTLAEAHVLWGVEVFAYCLMSNHVLRGAPRNTCTCSLRAARSLSANSCKGCINLTPSISTAAIATSEYFSLFGRGAIFLQAVSDPLLSVTPRSHVANPQSVG